LVSIVKTCNIIGKNSIRFHGNNFLHIIFLLASYILNFFFN
jgi:hypothetical protein